MAGRVKTVPKLEVSYRVSYQAVSSQKEKARHNLLLWQALRMSGRLDSNQRPPEPHSGALAKLRHAPSIGPFWTCAYCYHVPSTIVKSAHGARDRRIKHCFQPHLAHGQKRAGRSPR